MPHNNQLRQLIIESLHELLEDIEASKKKQPADNDDDEPRDIRKEPIWIKSKDKYLLIDDETMKKRQTSKILEKELAEAIHQLSQRRFSR